LVVTVIEVTDIHKRYGNVVALRGAHLEVAAGEVHVLIGANGCGKSTLCKIITGSVFADAGSIRLRGENVSFRTPAEASRAGIGVFYQELSLIPRLTVAENIFLRNPPRTRGGFVDRRRLRANAERALGRFGDSIGNMAADTLVVDLSADQQQIVEILKVLADEPGVILFDEPTAALDNRQVSVFFELMDELRR
jgi:ribose transport system ATP-binding protein